MRKKEEKDYFGLVILFILLGMFCAVGFWGVQESDRFGIHGINPWIKFIAFLVVLEIFFVIFARSLKRGKNESWFSHVAMLKIASGAFSATLLLGITAILYYLIVSIIEFYKFMATHSETIGWVLIAVGVVILWFKLNELIARKVHPR